MRSMGTPDTPNKGVGEIRASSLAPPGDDELDHYERREPEDEVDRQVGQVDAPPVDGSRYGVEGVLTPV